MSGARADKICDCVRGKGGEIIDMIDKQNYALLLTPGDQDSRVTR